MGTVEVRPAREGDAAAIRALVRAERLKPTGLDWRRFHVACDGACDGDEDGAEVVGVVQVRPEGPELASLVVRPDRRGQGLARRLIEAKLAVAPRPLYLVAPAALSSLYAPHGFVPVRLREAPRPIVMELVLGQVLGSLFALATGRRPRRIVAMVRA